MSRSTTTSPSTGSVAFAAAPAISIGRLPVGSRHFFGREVELRKLDEAWSDPGTRVVSIVALGGAGKSALVDRWIQGMQQDGWRGAERVFGWSFYSQGSSNTASGDTFMAVALKEFGDADPTVGNAWERGERLARLVKQKRTLLVLDGLEPLQAPPGPGEGKLRDPGVAALVRELSAAGEGLCVITSRLAVADLAAREGGSAPKIELEQLSAEDGARLLEALRVQGAKAELEEAARERKGHALALTLLGSYLAEVCGGDVRRRKEIGPLEGDATGGEHARHVMDAYVRWLGEGTELAVLRLLGLFDRPADEGCLRALREAPAIPGLTDGLVNGESREDVGTKGAAGAAGVGSGKPAERGVSAEVRWNRAVVRLRRLGLVAEASEGEPGSLDAHPLVREHFGVRLREEAPEAWAAGHGRLFEHLQMAAPELPEDTAAMAPLYAAVVHGCQAGRPQEAFDKVLWSRIHRGVEAFNVHKLGAFGAELGALAAFFDPPWTRVAHGVTEEWAAYLLNVAGVVLRALGRLQDAAEPFRLALSARLAQGDWVDAAIVASNLSELHLARGCIGDAEAAASRGVELAELGKASFWQMVNLAALANAHHQAGRSRDAHALFEKAEGIQETVLQSALLGSLGGYWYCDLLLAEGQRDYVVNRARIGLIGAACGGFALDTALYRLTIGRAHLAQALHDNVHLFPQARVELDDAVTLLRRAGNEMYAPGGLLARAELHVAAGDLTAAEHDLQELLFLATRCGMRLHEADAHLGFTRLHLARSDLAAARTSLTAARTLITQTGYHRRDPDLAALEAELARATSTSPAPSNA